MAVLLYKMFLRSSFVSPHAKIVNHSPFPLFLVNDDDIMRAIGFELVGIDKHLGLPFLFRGKRCLIVKIDPDFQRPMAGS